MAVLCLFPKLRSGIYQWPFALKYTLEEQGPYPYAVTMIEIAQIIFQLGQK